MSSWRVKNRMTWKLVAGSFLAAAIAFCFFQFAARSRAASAGNQLSSANTTSKSLAAPAGTTYTWNPAVPAIDDWTVPTNWSPTRLTPANNDVLVINTGFTPTLTNVPNQTIGVLIVSNNTAAKLQAGASGNTLTIFGATGSDLQIEAGSSITLDGSNALKISVASGSASSISGSVILQGGAHRLLAADVNGIIFAGGSNFTTSIGFTGNPFGTGLGGDGADQSVRFQDNSAAFFNAGGDPFGSSTNGVTTFTFGSLESFTIASAFSYDGRSYGKLTLDGNQTYSGGSSTNGLIVGGELNIVGGSTLTLSSAAGADLKLLNDLTVNGTLDTNGRTVRFGGGTLSNGATQTIKTTATFGDVAVSKLDAGGSVKLSNTTTINGALQFDGTGSAVDVLDLNQNTLNFNGSIGGTSSSTSNGFKGDVTGATLNIGGTGALGTLKFVSGSQTLKSLTVNRTSSGTVTLGSNLTVGSASAGSLTLTNGIVDVGSNTLSLAAFPTITRTNGYVIGNLQKTFGNTGNFTFTVGTANGYSPVDTNVTAGTGNSLTVKAIQGKHPNIPLPNALLRYWTITNSGSVTANLTFNYLAADVVGTEANYKIFKYNGSFTQFTPNTLNTTSHFATLNGVSSFSDWTLADPTLTVNTTDDVDNGSCLTSHCSLREAINAANSSSDPNTINFSFVGGDPGCSAGVCTISLGTALPNLASDMTITGTGASSLTVKRSSAGVIPSFRIFSISSGKTVTFSGLTISNGSATAVPSIGGGIYNQGTLTVNNCVISGNSAQSGGGGIFNDALISPASLTINNSTITGNQTGTSGTVGGAGGGIANAGTLNLINSTVNSNQTGNGLGSGGGDASAGGAGGGIDNSGTLTSVNSTVSGNRTGAGSGASHGGYGGGIRNSGTLTLSNVTISGNQTGGPNGIPGVGGGIHNSGTLTLANCTISDNQTGNTGDSGFIGYGSGGGVSNQGTANLKNTIAANNRIANGASGADLDGTFISQDYNLIKSGGNLTGMTTHNIIGVDPLLAPLANNGGPTLTHALLPGSPAINAGNNANLPADTFDLDGDANTAEPLPVDQRGVGFARVVNTTVDIGAFESRGFTIATTSGAGQAATINTIFAAPLVATVSSTFGEPVAGGSVTFTAPSSGASGTFTGGVTNVTVTVNSSGVATSPTFTANGTASNPPGVPYNVTASANGITGSASFALTNLKGNQTINFGALPNKTYGDADFGVSATASSGLAVSFVASNNCTISSTVHLTGAGSCTITASQAGDSNYNAAPDVPQTFSISKATTSTAVSSSVNPSDFGESVTFTATVSSTAGTPTGTVQFMDDATNLGSSVNCVAGAVNTCTAQIQTSTLTAGTHTISSSYSGDANFASSSGTLSGGQVVKAQPSLSINDVSTTEGDSGTKNFVFNVTLSAASHLQVKVDFAAGDGTATTADSDYQSNSGTLTFNAGDSTKTITVLVNGDQKFEPNEIFFVNLSNAVNATISDNQGLGTIVNDDAQGGIISFSQSNYNVNESDGFLTVTVNRTGDISSAATVDYATDDTGSPGPCATFNGFASSRCDFTTALGTLKFGPNEGQKSFVVLVNRDGYNVEIPSESFSVKLSNLTGGSVFGVPSTATVSILNSGSPTPNAIDDASNFVRQHYHDFLGREPDQSGLDFWTNQITVCGTDVGCTEVRRINVSVSFFLSIEFQETGYLVERLYKASYGDSDGTSTFNGTHPLKVPVVRLNEFLSDTQQIAQGVIVGQGNWPQQLETNKQNFINSLVTRSRFMAAFPSSMTAAQFVDALNSNAGNPLSPSERDRLVSDLTNNVKTRAQVLRAVAEDQDLVNAEFNRAFVLMQYFGYLRRNPNDPQDTDYTGYDFWLTKLNQFNGNYINAEMVKAFISSTEYRQRFGP
ncbi:MAG: hypothetical protein DMF72_02230 [Acidobacteria bacterium]|nr:MAG: hypothetical protein DMF72_02230 [Acidobacteriota bacterium]